MLLRLNQVARLSVVLLLLSLEKSFCRAAPCLDLYEGMPSPNLPFCSFGMPYSMSSMDQLCKGSVNPDPQTDDNADVYRPKVYNIDDLEEVSPIHGLAHKTIWYSELLCLGPSCVCLNSVPRHMCLNMRRSCLGTIHLLMHPAAH